MKKYLAPDTEGITIALESNFVCSSHYSQSPCVGCSDKNSKVCRSCENYIRSAYYDYYEEDEK